MPRPLKILLLLVALVLVAEGLVRVLPIGPAGDPPLAIDPDDTRYEPHPYLAFIPRKNWSTGTPGQGKWASHNSLGFRGPEFERVKPEGTYRIICMGGSSTYGHGPSGNDTTWPAQLETMLDQRYRDVRVEVINAGTSGYNSYESMINLAIRLIDLDPDLVLVYHGINDARNWQWPGLLPDNSHARANWPMYTVSPLVKALEKSRLFLLLRYYLTDYPQRLQLQTWVVKDYFEKVEQRMKDGYQEEGPAMFARNLESMVALARTHGVQIAFATQACFWDDLISRGDKLAVQRAQFEVKRMAKELRVPLADIAAEMPLDRAVFTNDVHVNDEGAMRLAALFAKFVVDQRFIEDR